MSESIQEIAKRLDMRHNVCIRVIDEPTGKVVSEHMGHNAATNTMLTGIGQYLMGTGSINGGELLTEWLPQYISVGTMGLHSQEEDEEGLPIGIGDADTGSEEVNFKNYIQTVPGFGSDGYDSSLINNRKYYGLGPTFANRASDATVACELISDSFPRSPITYRELLPEYESEYPQTLDVVFSAMISTGALAQFREADKDYVFITEAGLWADAEHSDTGSGLLAGYRIAPPDEENWDMSVPENREILRRNIIKVGTNQIAQIIWKIQLGGINQLGGIEAIYPDDYRIQWHVYM